MLDCFCVRGANARCLCVRVAIGASTTAEHAAAVALGVNHYARQADGISTLAAAGTAMPNASDATGAGAAKARAQK